MKQGTRMARPSSSSIASFRRGREGEQKLKRPRTTWSPTIAKPTDNLRRRGPLCDSSRVQSQHRTGGDIFNKTSCFWLNACAQLGSSSHDLELNKCLTSICSGPVGRWTGRLQAMAVKALPITEARGSPKDHLQTREMGS